VLAPDVAVFVRGALPPAPARVLEVGAGDGELAAAMAEWGYDVLAIDPREDAPGHVRQLALLEVDEPDGSFDAAVGVVSLHHVEPLEASCERLAALVRPGGRLVVDEIDLEAVDERAVEWWRAQRAAIGEPHEHPAPEVLETLRHHVHPLDHLRQALAPWFAVGEPVPGPYLHRWNLPSGLRDVEEALIVAGTLPAVGRRLVGIRRG
jgi:SAM-dependent methyltransferase